MSQVQSSVQKFGRRYPWSQWLSHPAGSTLIFVRGKDFNGRSDTFAQNARNQARKRGIMVGVTVSDDGERVYLKIM